MPYGSARRQQNTTRHYKQGTAILWKICWKFPRSNDEIIDIRVDENTILEQQLQKRLEQSWVQAKQNFKDYIDADIDNFRLVLPYYNYNTDGVKVGTNQQYLEIQKDQSLKQALQGNTIIEFPDIYVLLPNDFSKYPLVHQEK
eukprot:TRINITY_DN13414_c0_g1_i5.p3 TRINITY_DN13414_c0_g1~~TRINITY_DN13414_c0_g1_i5.p3  ORF type:complete len:143 (-),score=5.16 TRINITY_DN13414_c0_g1_i5:381-809(-)